MRRTDPPQPALNLLPALSLLMLLIPLTLLSTNPEHLGVIESTLPALGGCGGYGEHEPEPLSLAVLVHGEGFRVYASSPLLGCDGEGLEIPMAGGAYDHPRLAGVVADLKALHPHEDTAVLVPDERVSYEVIVAALDDLQGPASAPRFSNTVIAGGAR